jgi:hypothetical protein
MRQEKAGSQSTTAHNDLYFPAQRCGTETLSPGLNGASEKDVLFNMGFFIWCIPNTTLLPKLYTA